MLRLTLSHRPRRPQLLSFWLASGVSLGVAAGLIALALRIPGAFLLGAGAAIVCVVPGVLWPRLVSGSYQRWNRAAVKVSRAAELWTLAVCYFLIFRLVGRAGSTLHLEYLAPDSSAWHTRVTTPAAAYASLSEHARGPRANRGGISAVLRWSASSRNFWALSLLPFLLLLESFSSERQEKPPENNYTLY